MFSVGLIHTTEGSSIEGAVAALKAKRAESHEVYDPAQDRSVFLLADDAYARSLRNEPGGVETNRRESDNLPGPDIYQIEVVGFATEVPNYSDQWHRNLANRLKALSATHGIPLEFPCLFVPYPASYGERAAQRLSQQAFLQIRGWIGHQHVPENDHGDPGDISRTIAYALENTETEEVTQTLVQPADPNHPLFGSWWVSDGLHKAWVPDGDTYAALRYVGAKADPDGAPFKLPTPWFDMLAPTFVNAGDTRHLVHAEQACYSANRHGGNQTVNVSGATAAQVADELAKRLQS